MNLNNNNSCVYLRSVDKQQLLNLNPSKIVINLGRTEEFKVQNFSIFI